MELYFFRISYELFFLIIILWFYLVYRDAAHQ